MKRKIFSVLLALLTVFALASSASADVIWEPDDSFYQKHYEECDYVGRRYQLAGYDGTVTLFTAPGGTGKAVLDNGLQGTVQFTWEGNGVTWGYVCWLGDSDVEGWAPMDDLSLVYDSRQFIEEHQDLQEPDGALAVDFRQAVLYNYPRGTTYGEVLQEHRDYMPFSESFSSLYTDEEGLRWGYISYYMGRRGIWICIDDPMNGQLDTGIVPVAPSAAQQRGSATVGGGTSMLPLAVALVAAVVAVTAVLLVRMKKREA